MFPLSNPIFRSFGPDGVSMFLWSSVVAQLVFSGGASVFGGGNANMMIEVIPFLHSMYFTVIPNACNSILEQQR